MEELGEAPAGLFEGGTERSQLAWIEVHGHAHGVFRRRREFARGRAGGDSRDRRMEENVGAARSALELKHGERVAHDLESVEFNVHPSRALGAAELLFHFPEELLDGVGIDIHWEMHP